MYLLLKQIHLTAVALSIGLFVLRGAWMLRGSARLRQRWVRVLPHVVDTVLLASAIGLAWTLRQYPLAQGWLTAKVLALLLYIVLGMLALRPGRSLRLRRSCFAAALGVFGYIVSVAMTRDPWGAFAPLATAIGLR